MAISETKGQGWRAIPTQRRKASDILTTTLAAFLFSSHPKRERDREAHLNYCASAYNRGRQLSHSNLEMEWDILAERDGMDNRRKQVKQMRKGNVMKCELVQCIVVKPLMHCISVRRRRKNIDSSSKSNPLRRR